MISPSVICGKLSFFVFVTIVSFTFGAKIIPDDDENDIQKPI